MSRRRALVLAAGILLAVALLVLFAIYNRGNPIVLEFGFARWRGEAVYALYGAVSVGLLLMFLVGLPADLASRGERRRLERRVRDLAARADAGPRSIGPSPRERPSDEGGERPSDEEREEPASEASR